MAVFKITPTDIGGYIIENFFSVDNRGSFTKLFEQGFFSEKGIDFHFSESIVSRSDKNVVRGMHFQTFHPQAKLVTVIRGRIYDVIIDLRKESETYGQWRGYYLSSENHRSLYVPKGFAHGFLSLEDNSEVLYHCDGEYDKGSDTGIIFNDDDIAIDWPTEISKITVGNRDRGLMTFKEFDREHEFTYICGGGVELNCFCLYFNVSSLIFARLRTNGCTGVGRA